MSDIRRQDLEREAREAAERWYPPGAGRLGGKLYAGKPAKEGFRERSSFQHGYLAAATAREKEIAELNVRNKDLTAAIGSWQSAHESDQREIASLRAKLEAVPVDCILAILNYADAPWIVAKDSRDFVRRWLAGLGK